MEERERGEKKRQKREGEREHQVKCKVTTGSLASE
jgi:hypothetical protein